MIVATDATARSRNSTDPEAGTREIRRKSAHESWWRIGFGVFAVAISLGFFLESQNARYYTLSGDQLNILTVCVSQDYPGLLKDDEIAGNANNLGYYIPAFVGLVRLASLPDKNYLRGLSILLFFTSLIYMFGWWLLFSIWGDRLVAAVLAFVVRGITWPPGNELWGIAGVWTMLPRTLFLALLPWVLLAWIRWRGSGKGLALAAFGCGLLVNIHPISGASVAAAIIAGETVWSFVESRNLKAAAARAAIGVVAALAGMAPYVWIYLSSLGSMQGVDPVELEAAAKMRIRSIFWEPGQYIERWLRPKWLMFLLAPWAGALILARGRWAEMKGKLAGLGAFTAACAAVVLLPFLAEALLSQIGVNNKFAFQLVRGGKYAIVPSLILAAFVLTAGAERLRRYGTRGLAALVAICLSLVILTSISRSEVFESVPFLGDDISRSLWPSLDDPYESVGRGRPEMRDSIDGVLTWISTNTDQNARFVGPRVIRVGALRSVIHDFAGAVMLIEGNPRAFVESARRERLLRTPELRDPVARSEVLAELGADFWVTTTFDPRLRVAYSNEDWFVYDLRAAGPESSTVLDE